MGWVLEKECLTVTIMTRRIQDLQIGDDWKISYSETCRIVSKVNVMNMSKG